jgi:hypothetical protein
MGKATGVVGFRRRPVNKQQRQKQRSIKNSIQYGSVKVITKICTTKNVERNIDDIKNDRNVSATCSR